MEHINDKIFPPRTKELMIGDTHYVIARVKLLFKINFDVCGKNFSQHFVSPPLILTKCATVPQVSFS